MNPYASEEFNRIKVKGQPKPSAAPSEPAQMDHPLFEGKKMDISKQELKSFTKAMEQEEFRSLLSDYIKEISDPNNKAEYEQYLRQLEEQGDLPPGTELIKPSALFCIKTTAKRLISDINKQYFDQKAFVNVCLHEQIEKPKREHVTQSNGQKGYAWSLPYRVSKGRHDQDKTGNFCTTYDVVFHPDIGQFISHPDFKKFVADTAIDGVNKVIAEHKEKVSTDYKILKHLVCKGGEPGLLTVKVASKEALLNNYDVNKHETKLQKELDGQKKEDKEKSKELGEIEEDELEDQEEEPRPTSVVQPKYKVVHSFPADLQSCWEGPQVEELTSEGVPKHKVPQSLTVTIFLPHAESMKEANLEINESTLIFAYPEIYYLDLNLKYKVQQEKGKAKFDKTKKTLTIQLPVLGLSEDSKKVLEDNYLAFQEHQRKREEQFKLQQQFQEESGLQVPEFTVPGSSTKVLPATDIITGEEIGPIVDEYGGPASTVDLDKLKQEALSQGEELNDRERFLKIYKGPQTQEEEEEESLANREIRLSSQQKEGKPLIQEIEMEKKEEVVGAVVEEERQALGEKEEVGVKFDWETAERVELKHQFIHQKELVFVNIPFKGYDKNNGVRYAMSNSEIFIEVRHPQTQQVHLLGKTLYREVDISQSSIDFLVDFIALKLKKFEVSQSWSTLGYDISKFMVPKRGQMKSNFVKRVEEAAEANKENVNWEQKQNEEAKKEEVVVEEDREEEIQKALEKVKLQQTTFMNLECATIFQIY